ncbi:MAG: type I glyceraldehyde-3-phosphate dehydrogenase [Pseudomonadales bacterium]
MKRVAINGMGRTGRVMLRRWLSGEAADVDIVAVNDIIAVENLAYLLRYDSVHGRLPWPVSVAGDTLQIGDRSIRCFSSKDPSQLPWGELGIDVVIECSGQFTRREQAAQHIAAGATRVLIGAPSEDADVTVVLGVNHQDYDPASHYVISNASCTTNSLVPALMVLRDNFGLESVTMTTVHAYTASQAVVDRAAAKMGRGRAAGVSMIPTTTGADKAAGQVMPELKGKISALAIRVPVPDGSLTDISALVSASPSAAEVNAAFRAAAEGGLSGILGYSEEDLVSVDILGEPYSGLVHARATRVTGRLVKVYVWYDNETGYACRCLDVVGSLL